MCIKQYMYQLHRLHVHAYTTKARAIVSRQYNDVKRRICITKEKLDYNAESYRGKNTSVAHEAKPLIQLLLTISNAEARPSHSEWVCV